MAENNSAAWKVARVERWISLIGGGALVIYGLARRSFIGIVLAFLGGDLIYHELAREDPHIHQVFGLELPPELIHVEVVPKNVEIRVQRSVTINRSAQDLYRFWRNLENLPRVFDFIHSVRTSSSSQSHWVTKSPTGHTIEWDSEITDDIPNQLIGWRSVAGSSVTNVGSVSFVRSANGRGTRINVTLDYDLAPGPTAEAFAELLGGMPSQVVREQLSRLKELLEKEKVNPIRATLKTLLESR